MIPENIKALILDMDGVIWKADAPIGDLPAIFKRIRERGLKFVFATNNATKTPADYKKKLFELGVEVDESQVVTSALGLAFMLSQKYARGTKIFMIGENGVENALKEKGFEILDVSNAGQAEVFVMGIDREINFQKISEAVLLVKAGIPFYTTNTDRTFPTPRGEIAGSGSWCSIITSATGVEPMVAGKPFPYLMELSLERLGISKAETLIVGDRLETDIEAGQKVGCPVALVLSGVSSIEEAEKWNPKIDLIASDLSELTN